MMKYRSSANKRVRASAESSVIIIVGLALTAIALPSDGAVDVFSVAAIGVGLSLGLATGIEAMAGVGRLIRADMLMLWVLYGLTFFEFLFPQPDVDSLVSPVAATNGTYAVLLGFAGLVVGRHLVPLRYTYRPNLFAVQVRPAHIFLLFVALSLTGYLHMLLGVNFDLIEMLKQMSWPRFEQSWARGKYGGLYSLVYELGLLISLVPPMAALIYARKNEFGLFQKTVVALILMLTFYNGFASGTRSVLAVYIIGFTGTYFLVKPGMNLRRALVWGVPMLLLLFFGTKYMLEFRNVGLASFEGEQHYTTVFIDQNIVNVSLLTQVFPDSVDYLGSEIPIAALIRPIPQFLWPEKPEGLSTGIEAALGASPGMTLSCTFVGEAYMAGGLLSVLIFSLGFGAAAEMWNRVGRDIGSPISQLLYASGFLCAAIGMRSMLSLVPLLLPTFALWLCVKYWLPSLQSAARRR